MKNNRTIIITVLIIRFDHSYWFPHTEVRVLSSLLFTQMSILVRDICCYYHFLRLGEPQDEFVHNLRPGPGHRVLGDAVPGQELPQDPHLQAGDQDQAQELHGPARHCQGLHSHHFRWTGKSCTKEFESFLPYSIQK